MNQQATFDQIVVGGGVIGLSVAYELAKRSQRVALLERGTVGREASWAGAGILPAAATRHGGHAYEQLASLAAQLHPVWAQQLREETGIDNEFEQHGGIYLARSRGDEALLRAGLMHLPDEGIEVEQPDLAALKHLEPGLGPAIDLGTIKAGFMIPRDAALRNPRHLSALRRACEWKQVTLLEDREVQDIEPVAGQLAFRCSSGEKLNAKQGCICAGPWSQPLLAKLGIQVPIVPIRGQMILFRTEQRTLKRVLNEGNRYIVPRRDGRLLVGASEEETGFVKADNPVVIEQLRAMAIEILPWLEDAPLENTWTGLRPSSLDSLPFIGPIPGCPDLFLASGHFRAGLFLSPATAVVLADQMLGTTPPFDPAPLGLLRS